MNRTLLNRTLLNETLLLLFALMLAAGCDCAGPLPEDDGGLDGSVEDDAGSAGDSGGEERDGDVPAPGCGDSVVSGSETCDDGNSTSGDGCSAACELEEDFACPMAGRECVRVVTCGNARIEGDETCDDRNAVAGDGCDADCHLEPGWLCTVVGVACTAAECGDGFRVGFEACDDGNTAADDGCDGSCQLEDGFVCPDEGAPCEASTCGDAVVEGTEECDDGNLEIGDGCTPFCTREPDCTDGTCVAVCGDEVVFAPETCDDGNTIDGDGCSSDCRVEAGFTCTEVPLDPPDSVVLPVVVRDFLPACADGQALTTFPLEGSGEGPPYGHPDFQCYNPGLERGMVETTLTDGRPVLLSTSPNGDRAVESAASFDLWYRTNTDYSRVTAQGITLIRMGGAYQFDNESFFPLSHPEDGSAPVGWVAEGIETAFDDSNGLDDANFFFTSEVRYWFEYNGTESLAFSGDDDVWVFINERLAVDIGGVHGRQNDSITLSECADGDPAMNEPECLAALDLRVGGIYEAVVFQAERHTSRSQYRLTLTNFNRAPSECVFECGDGIVTRFEQCDDGEANGAEYDGCSATCMLTPFCGDGVVQEAFGETCDDGVNLGGTASACSPGCMGIGAACGDGVVQTDAGEQCDDGNTESLDGCDAECQFELL